MANRSRVNPRKDKRAFRKYAIRTKAKNLPGHNLARGGTCL